MGFEDAADHRAEMVVAVDIAEDALVAEKAEAQQEPGTISGTLRKHGRP